MTANAGSRSFWVNILMDIMLFSNFSNVSAAQLDESMPAESTATTLEERVDGGCVLTDLIDGCGGKPRGRLSVRIGQQKISRSVSVLSLTRRDLRREGRQGGGGGSGGGCD
jgi:hypothetical protein